jgi:dihydroorotase
LLKVDESNVCGVKIFMGSSTGDMLVDDPIALENIFSQVKTIITTHCEYDPLVKENAAKFKAEFGDNLTAKHHPLIRSKEACYLSSSFAVQLAKKHNTRLHVLHISSKEELDLFENNKPLSEKRITAEACVHHLWFSDADYETKGNYIKWNPAVKTAEDRAAIWKAVNDGRIDVIATDHAPHTIAEKEQAYITAPSGGPLIQHSLQAMIECSLQGKITLENVVQKMCHNPAILFDIDRRGFIREGFWADLVLVDMNKPETVTKENILYKCGWSPFEGYTFKASIDSTIVSGHLTYQNGIFNETKKGNRLRFNR